MPQASTLPTLGCGTYADLHGPPKTPGHTPGGRTSLWSTKEPGTSRGEDRFPRSSRHLSHTQHRQGPQLVFCPCPQGLAQVNKNRNNSIPRIPQGSFVRTRKSNRQPAYLGVWVKLLARKPYSRPLAPLLYGLKYFSGPSPRSCR